MSAKSIATFRSAPGNQRGAALMVLLIIMIVGMAAIFVSSLNSSALHITRDKVTADALTKAKEALIGRAVADLTSPGSLPCPDTNDDGSADLFSGNNCPSYIGRLPWKTLGLPDLRDGSGEHLWYALSPNFRDYVSVNPINSNSVGNLTVSGTIAAANVVAIVFAAGPPVSGQSRSFNPITCATSNTTIAENLCATNYLEGSNPALNTATAPNLNYQSADSTSTFNDRLMIINAGDIIPSVEMRVAKELTNAFASYLAANGEYPNPANFTTACSANSTTSCPSDSAQCIGKVPATEMNLYATLPWFTDNKWFDVIYYTVGTNRLAPGAVAGNHGWGRRGRWGGGGGGGGGSASGSGTGCYAPTLSVSGSSANALFLLPGTPLGVNRTGSMSAAPLPSGNLPSFFEDVENQNLDNVYVLPGASSNDSLYLLP